MKEYLENLAYTLRLALDWLAFMIAHIASALGVLVYQLFHPEAKDCAERAAGARY